MASEITIEFQDAQLENSSMSYWTTADTLANIQAQVTDIKGLSNAKITKVTQSRAIELLTITNNTPEAANNETVKVAAKFTFGGVDVGSPGKNFSQTTLSIPAPIGELMPYSSTGAYANDINTILNNIVTAAGVNCTRLVSSEYKGRK
jgi:hypothetical protein